MASKATLRLSLIGLAALGVAAAWAWSQRRATPVELAPTTMAPADATPAAPAAPTRAPESAEVKAKVERLFGPVVTWSGGPFAAGDFNADGSQDLAVVVEAADVARLNQEPSNWILQDPEAARTRRPGAVVPRPKVAAEPVLVIVHGYQADGWRSGEAQQTYVLSGVAGTDLRGVPIRTAAAEAQMAVAEGREGDVLVERLRSGRGFLCWSGALYEWIPLPPPSTAPR
jgi:hypothetical protein